MEKKIKRTRFFELLKSRNITGYTLSKRLGYKERTTVYKWLYGISEPNAATMLKLMQILDVSAEEILCCFAEGGKMVITEE